MVKFDETDIKILRELNKNVRVTVTEIAEKTGISRPTISNRIKKLFDNELILSHCGLNMGKLGYKMAAEYIRIKEITKEISVFIQFLCMSPYIA